MHSGPMHKKPPDLEVFCFPLNPLNNEQSMFL